MAFLIAVCDATSGNTCRFVMNEMSSRANTFVGSAMARASELPIFRTGMTSYFLAMGAGTSLRTSESMSSWASVIEGTPYCRERNPISCSSLR